MKKSSSLTYSKSNDMIQMRGTVVRRDPLTETKRKIIALEASKVKESDTHETVYTIIPKEVIDLCGIEKNGRTYDQIFTEIYDLKTKALAFVNERGNISIESYMENIEINREDCFVTYTIPKNLLPHFKRYAPFTKLDLLEYMPMRGQYALLLYELLMSWREKGEVYYTLKDLRRLLEVPEGAYPKNADFLKRVVYGAVDQINERNKGRKIKYQLKYGYRRKVEGVEFLIPKYQELSPVEDEPTTLEQLEAKGQISILDVIENTPEPTPVPGIVTELVSHGVDEEEAMKYLNEHGEDRLRQNLDKTLRAHAKKKKDDLAASIVFAIQRDLAKKEQERRAADIELKKRAKEKNAALEAALLAEQETAGTDEEDHGMRDLFNSYKNKHAKQEG